MEKIIPRIMELFAEQDPPLSAKRLAEMTGIDEATVRRYVNGDVKRPDYDKAKRLLSALGDDLNSSAAIAPPEVRQISDVEQLQNLVLELRQINLTELERVNLQWSQRLDASEQAHREEVLRLSQTHADHITHLQDGNRQQLKIMEQLVSQQTSSDASVRSYLKRRIRNLFITCVIVVIFAILQIPFSAYSFYAYQAFDKRDPSRGIYRASPTPYVTSTPDPTDTLY